MGTPHNIADAVARIQALPALPSVLSRIVAATADPDASALDLSRHVAADQSLTATLLRVVNSAYYGHYRQVDSITTAIVMLGFHEVRNLTLATTALRSFPKGHPEFDRTQLWRHSLAVAMAAERFATAENLARDGCFVAGLLHDIGKVVLDVLYPDSFREAVLRALGRGGFVRECEAEIFGIDHAGVGGILAERWDLPPTIVEAIRCHHHPEWGTLDVRLAGLVNAADFVAYAAGLGETSNGRAPTFPEAANAAPHLDSVAVHLREHRGLIDEFLGALVS